MEIDIPHIWKYFGELVGSPVAAKYLPLKTLGDSASRLQKRSAYKMLAEVLLTAVSHSVSSVEVMCVCVLCHSTLYLAFVSVLLVLDSYFL